MMSTKIQAKHCRKCGAMIAATPKNKWSKGRCENPVCRKIRRKSRDSEAPFKCEEHKTYHGLQRTKRDCFTCQSLWVTVNS